MGRRGRWSRCRRGHGRLRGRTESRRTVAEQPLHPLDQVGNRQRNAPAAVVARELREDLGHVPPQHVSAGEDQVDRLPAEHELSATSRVEHRLQLMRQPLQHDQLEYTGVALERVEDAEHDID